MFLKIFHILVYVTPLCFDQGMKLLFSGWVFGLFTFMEGYCKSCCEYSSVSWSLARVRKYLRGHKYMNVQLYIPTANGFPERLN